MTVCKVFQAGLRGVIASKVFVFEKDGPPPISRQDIPSPMTRGVGPSYNIVRGHGFHSNIVTVMLTFAKGNWLHLRGGALARSAFIRIFPAHPSSCQGALTPSLRAGAA